MPGIIEIAQSRVMPHVGRPSRFFPVIHEVPVHDRAPVAIFYGKRIEQRYLALEVVELVRLKNDLPS